MNGPVVDPVSVSIIIPCRNEERFIDECLQTVYSFEPIAGGFEVLVVDGASTDRTREIVQTWAARHANLRLLENPGRIVPKALNIGIAQARGEWILRLDAHSRYAPDYLRLCLETALRTGAENVGGVCHSGVRVDTPGAQLVRALTTHRFGVGNAAFRLQPAEGPADTVPFGFYRKEDFTRFGTFDERLVRNQDYEFNLRIRRGGGSIWLNPKIEAVYYNKETVRGLLQQAYSTAQWNSWMWAIAPYTFALRHCVPGAFVLALLGATLLTALSGTPGAVLLALVLVPYLFGAILASVTQANRYGWWMFGSLVCLFFVYHVAYGLGILVGAIRLMLGNAPVQRSAG
jgi:succinoglycan biosynthesis protein ExoA